MQRIAIAILVVLDLAAAGCKKKNDGEAQVGGGSAAAGSETAGASARSGGDTQPTAGSGSDTGSPVATGTPLSDCDAWIAAVDKLATCDKLKPKADAIRQTADIMRALLPDIRRSGDAKKIERTAAECRTNLEAIKASGCPL